MNYDALMAFATFAEHRNFTRAARELHISQPALHQKVSKLAEQLDTELYTRDGRDLILTNAGDTLAAHAREVAELTDDVLARIDDDHRRNPVVLAARRGAFLHILGPAIQHALEGPYPLRMTPMSAADAAEALREARIHLAVNVFETHHDHLTHHPVCEVGQQVVLPEDHPLADRDSLSPDDLADQPLIVAPEGQPHRLAIAHTLADHDVPWRVGAEATGWPLMMRFALYGMGITVINDFVPVPDGLVGISAPEFPSFQYEAAIRADTHSDAAQWLLEAVISHT
jgi:DNA-binding transcriptional LysR family regulator